MSDKEIADFIKTHDDWFHFSYRSGANPYIAVNDKIKTRIMKKYRDKLHIDVSHLGVFITINDL